MPEYTKEQIDGVMGLLEQATALAQPLILGFGESAILLSALSTSEQERDALAAYAAKLEKAGDKIRNYKPDSNQLQAETDIEELFDAWDAARKEKP